MDRKLSLWMAVCTLLGLCCGLALSLLVQPGSAAAQSFAASGAGGGLEGQKPGGLTAGAKFGAPASESSATAGTSRAFSYQGVLRQGGLPVNGSCDLQFSAWDAGIAGSQMGST